MNAFEFVRARTVAEAIAAGSSPGSAFLAGGTNLVDLMRENIERPERVVDVTGLSQTIEAREGGGLLIGAAATNTGSITGTSSTGWCGSRARLKK